MFRGAVVPAADMPFEFFGECFVFPEFFEDGLVEEVLDVTSLEIVGFRCYLPLQLSVLGQRVE